MCVHAWWGWKGLGCELVTPVLMLLTRVHLHRAGFQFKIPDRFHMNKGFHCLKRKGIGWSKAGSHVPIAVLPCCVKKFGFYFIFLTMWNSLKDFKQGRLLYNGITGWLKRGRVEAGRPPWGLVPSITFIENPPGAVQTWEGRDLVCLVHSCVFSTYVRIGS